jgi:hypothetical protein
MPTGVFRSRDGGGTWESLNDGIEGRSVRRLLLLAGGRRLIALANPAEVFVYDFVPSAAVPDMSVVARILMGGVLAVIGLLAIRGNFGSEP